MAPSSELADCDLPTCELHKEQFLYLCVKKNLPLCNNCLKTHSELESADLLANKVVPLVKGLRVIEA